MSLLLKDRVYTMESQTAKRGVYPLHGFKLGLYRLPFKLDDPLEIKSIHDGLKKAFEMEIYADRVFATYHWSEENMPDQFGSILTTLFNSRKTRYKNSIPKNHRT